MKEQNNFYLEEYQIWNLKDNAVQCSVVFVKCGTEEANNLCMARICIYLALFVFFC